MAIYTDLLQDLKGERLSSVFSPDGTLISASAAPHCGREGRRGTDVLLITTINIEDGQYSWSFNVSTVVGNKATVSENITVEKQPVATRKPNSARELPFSSLDTQSCKLSPAERTLISDAGFVVASRLL